MKFSSLVVKKIFILLGIVAAMIFEVVPVFANQMVSGADLKKEIHAFLATKNFVGNPAISDTRLFPNCLTGIKVKPMFGSIKTVELACADPGRRRCAGGVRSRAGFSGFSFRSDESERGRRRRREEERRRADSRRERGDDRSHRERVQMRRRV